jgi:hypothetical protein
MSGGKDSTNIDQQLAWSRLWALIISRVAQSVTEDDHLREVSESSSSEDSCAEQDRM